MRKIIAFKGKGKEKGGTKNPPTLISSPPQKDTSTILSMGVADDAVRKGTVDYEILDAISEFQSPKAAITQELDSRPDVQEHLTKKNSNASYVYNLSKKVSSISTRTVTAGAVKTVRKKSVVLSSRDPKSLVVRRGRTSDGGISAKMSPRSGRVIVDLSKRKSTSSGTSDGSDVADDSDGLEGTMSDEEDGDF